MFLGGRDGDLTDEVKKQKNFLTIVGINSDLILIKFDAKIILSSLRRRTDYTRLFALINS